MHSVETQRYAQAMHGVSRLLLRHPLKFRSLGYSVEYLPHELARRDEFPSRKIDPRAIQLTRTDRMPPGAQSGPRAGGLGIGKVFVIIKAAGHAPIIKEFNRPGYQQNV